MANTKIIAGVVVLAALGGGIFFAQKKDKEIGNTSTTAADLPDIKAPDDFDKLEIQNGDKTDVVLEKKGDKWVMTKPVADAPANQTNVDSVVKNLKELKAKEVISPTPTDDTKKDYDFTKEKQVHVTTFKAGDKKTDITFGASGARGQMATVEGKQPIYAVTGYSSYLYQRDVKGFRDTEILKFDDANANSLVLEKKNDKKTDTLSFTKDGDNWAGTFNGKAIDRFDADKVKDALRSFKNLTADDFGDGKTTADTGLDDPMSKVTIKLKDGAATYAFRVGGVSTGTNHWVKREDTATIYSLPSFTADWANADVAKFQKADPKDAGAPKDGGGAPKMPTPGLPDPHVH